VRSTSCEHPDVDSLFGNQTLELFPLRFRCEWPPPAPRTPAVQTGLLPTVLLVMSVIIVVVGVTAIWRTRPSQTQVSQSRT